MKTNKDYFYDNFIYSIILTVVSSIAALFIFGQPVAVSIILGGATILWGMSLLAKQMKKLNQISEAEFKRNRTIQYIIRMILYAVVLVISYFTSNLNIYGTLYGLLTFKIMIYVMAMLRSFGIGVKS